MFWRILNFFFCFLILLSFFFLLKPHAYHSHASVSYLSHSILCCIFFCRPFLLHVLSTQVSGSSSKKITTQKNYIFPFHFTYSISSTSTFHESHLFTNRPESVELLRQLVSHNFFLSFFLAVFFCYSIFFLNHSLCFCLSIVKTEKIITFLMKCLCCFWRKKNSRRIIFLEFFFQIFRLSFCKICLGKDLYFLPCFDKMLIIYWRDFENYYAQKSIYIFIWY